MHVSQSPCEWRHLQSPACVRMCYGHNPFGRKQRIVTLFFLESIYINKKKKEMKMLCVKSNEETDSCRLCIYCMFGAFPEERASNNVFLL